MENNKQDSKYNAGKLNLEAIGNELRFNDPDFYLTGNPQITFFKSVYKRHTNFSSFWKKIDFRNEIKFGSKVICKIDISEGDLLGDLVLSFILPKITASGGDYVKWTDRIGHALVEEVTLKIGNREIVKHTGEWLELQSQLCLPSEKKLGYDNLIGTNVLLNTEANSIPEYQIFIPMQFWFCKDIGLALPLIALYHPESALEIELKLRDFDSLYHKSNSTTVVTTEKNNIEANFLGKFYLLEDKERVLFSQKSHKYLIEQVQSIKNLNDKKINLDFKLPVKELIWFSQREITKSKTYNKFDSIYDYNNHFDFTSSPKKSESYNMYVWFSIYLNNTNNYIFEKFETQYLSFYLPYKHHSNIPNTGVYLYSFSENPEQYQPSGSCNFSRLDINNCVLTFQENGTGTGKKSITIYASNYNFLLIDDGQGIIEYTQ